jgi:tRNA(Ile)-lysidine synthase
VKAPSLTTRMLATIRGRARVPPGSTLLVAVSGGADSVALLDALRRIAPRLRLRLAVAHLNHGIRGRAADADAAFVRALAKAHKLPCVVGRADVPRLARRRGVSLEMAAREARYRFLAAAARRTGADAIATAHTADDQAETILLNLLRGTGAQGLAGIPYVGTAHGRRIVRPLLEATRADVVAYLRRRRLAWREDATNRDPAFLRNRVRHELLPLLEARFNPRVRAALLRAGHIAEAEDAWLEDLAGRALAGCLARGVLSADRLRALPLGARRRVLRLWLARAGVPASAVDFDAVERLDRAVRRDRGSERVALRGGWTAQRAYGELRLRRAAPSPAPAFRRQLRIPGRTVLRGPGVEVTAQLAPGLVRERPPRPGAGPARASLSTAAWARRPLTARSWKPGDRMRPFGMKGSKKVQDILVDAKVPRAERAAVPIVECGGEIVWIPGYRIAQGWEVRDPAGEALQLAVRPLPATPDTRRTRTRRRTSR